MTETQLADRIANRRSVAAISLAIAMVAAQVIGFPETAVDRPQWIHIGAWIVWGTILLLFLVWGGGLWRDRALRATLNDESTQAHRQRALTFGFWAALTTACIVYAASWYEPISGREGARLILTATIAGALLRFGMLERRALRDG